MPVPIDFIIVSSVTVTIGACALQMAVAFDRLVDHLRRNYPDKCDGPGRSARIPTIDSIHSGRRRAIRQLITGPPSWASDDPVAQKRVRALRGAYTRFWVVFVVGAVAIVVTCVRMGTS